MEVEDQKQKAVRDGRTRIGMTKHERYRKSLIHRYIKDFIREMPPKRSGQGAIKIYFDECSEL